MEHSTDRLRRWASSHGTVFKWLLFAGIIGLVVGGVSTAFYYAFRWATGAQQAHRWLLGLLPLGGMAIVALYRLCGMERDRGTNFVLVAVRENTPLPLRTAPLVFLSTIITHLVGGSSGREGLSSRSAALFPPPLAAGCTWMTRTAVSSPCAACRRPSPRSSATPLAAAMFAMEVVSVGVLYYAAIVPCVVASIVGLWVAQAFQVPPTAFQLSGIPDLTPVTLVQVILMGVLFALLSILFCRLMHLAPHLYEKYLPNPFLRAAAGGAWAAR